MKWLKPLFQVNICRTLSTMTEKNFADNANIVRERIRHAAIAVNRDPDSISLIAVSKTKSVEDIQQLYEAGQRKFGENYFQELCEKAPLLPSDIEWHFIGHLQSTKASKLIREIPNLKVVETVDSQKLAGKLNTALETVGKTLEIFLQVHTGNEETKSGVMPSEVNELADFIKNDCLRLKIKGLMTIGAPGDFSCFDELVDCRQQLANHWEVDPSTLELSMGMSADFEQAITQGATSVRVGSTIFGPRLYPKK